MDEYLMKPFPDFQDEWARVKRRNCLASTAVVRLIAGLRRGDENLEELIDNALEEGLTEDFVGTVMIAMEQSSDYRKYLDLILKGG